MKLANVLSVFLLATAVAGVAAAQEDGAAPPPPRSLSGINAPDLHPDACVSCHVDMPQIGVDARLSVVMKRWENGVEPEILGRVRSAVPDGVTLAGRHPSVDRALGDVPASCISCHRKSRNAPPFEPMIHLIHLTGGETNHYMKMFGGECTLCHKLEASGAWKVPSSPEKEVPPASR